MSDTIKVETEKSVIMWATAGWHLTGDLSRDSADHFGDFAVIYKTSDHQPMTKWMHGRDVGLPMEEQVLCYVGNWLTGFGFIEVKFPVQSTRRLTWFEADHLEKQVMVTL